MKFPVIIVEVPHQQAPRVWIAHHLSKLIEAAYNIMGDDYQVHPIPDELADQFDEDGDPITAEAEAAYNRVTTIEDADDALEVLRYDLNSLIVIEDQEDYDLEIVGDPQRGDHGHGWLSYIADLELAGIELGYQEEEDENDIQG